MVSVGFLGLVQEKVPLSEVAEIRIEREETRHSYFWYFVCLRKRNSENVRIFKTDDSRDALEMSEFLRKITGVLGPQPDL